MPVSLPVVLPRSYSFTSFSTGNPTTPLPGNQVDTNLDATNATASQMLTWSRTVIADTGGLKSGVVEAVNLSPGLLATITASVAPDISLQVSAATSASAQAVISAAGAVTAATLSGTRATSALASASAASTSASDASASATLALTRATTAGNHAANAAISLSDATLATNNALFAAHDSRVWADYLDGVIPPDVLTRSSVSGDHNSARWHANAANASAATALGAISASAASAASAAASATTATTQAGIATAASINATDRWDSFRTQYFGPLASAPTLDPMGDALAAGDLYYDTDLNALRVRTALGTWSDIAAGDTNPFARLNGSTFVGPVQFAPGTAVPFTIAAAAQGIVVPGLRSATADAWSTARTLSLTGDVTGAVSQDGSGDTSMASTLAASGVTAGTYSLASITVDAKGRVTSASSNTAAQIALTNATASTGTTTGALKVTGGVGIGGALNVAGVVTIGGALPVLQPAANEVAVVRTGSSDTPTLTGWLTPPNAGADGIRIAARRLSTADANGDFTAGGIISLRGPGNASPNTVSIRTGTAAAPMAWNFNADGSMTIPGILTVAAQGGSEGGEIHLAKPPTGSSINGDIVFDVATNTARIFEAGGSNRGIYIDLTACAAGTGSKVWHSSNFNPASYLPLSGGTLSGVLNANGNITINNAGPTINLQDTDQGSAILHCNSNNFYILSAPTNSTSAAAPPNGRWPFTVGTTTGDIAIGRNLDVTGGSIYSGSTITAASSVSGSIFQGGPGGSAYLNMYGGNACNFRWSPWGLSDVSMRVNEATEFHLLRSDNCYQVGSLDWGGTWSTGVWQSDNAAQIHFPNASSSDERFKDNISDTDVDALAAIMATPIRKYDWNEDGLYVGNIYTDLRHVPIGVVAQEVVDHIPEAALAGPTQLSDGSNEYRYKVRYDQMVPYLLRGMQQQQEMIAQQAALIASLTTRIAALESA